MLENRCGWWFTFNGHNEMVITYYCLIVVFSNSCMMPKVALKFVFLLSVMFRTNNLMVARGRACNFDYLDSCIDFICIFICQCVYLEYRLNPFLYGKIYIVFYLSIKGCICVPDMD